MAVTARVIMRAFFDFLFFIASVNNSRLFLSRMEDTLQTNIAINRYLFVKTYSLILQTATRLDGCFHKFTSGADERT